MVHKFCENHLAELYEAVKAGEISKIEKIEHELTPSEECVACAYVLKAKGGAKKVLLEYLRSEGLSIESSQNTGLFSGLLFWIIKFGIFSIFFIPIFVSLLKIWPAVFSFIFAFFVATTALVLVAQFLER